MSSCFVCCEKFNHSNRKQIICPNFKCEFLVCKTCVRQYLLSQKEPHCMNCKQGWNERFIISQTNKSFFDNDFKKTRKQFLLDSEISKLPATMQAAENHKLIQYEESLIKEIDIKIKEFNKQLNELKIQKNEKFKNIYKLKNSLDPQGRKKFIMPCPHDGCRGFLSQQYKCEICNLFTCPTCHEVIGYNKTDPHQCNPTSVQSAELIKKDTKPCPNCGIRIFKISGCDQMWCTECEVTFSWNKGSILTNVQVHNPHFLNRQREINNGNIPRAPGDILCGGLCSYHSLRTYILINLPSINKTMDKSGYVYPADGDITKKVMDWYRFVGHISDVNLLNTRHRVQELNNNENLRIQYIIGEKTRDQLANILVRNDGTRKKLIEMLNLYELLSVVGIESFAFLVNANLKEKSKTQILEIVNDIYNKYINLLDNCNREFRIISTTYNCMVPQIKLNDKVISHQQNEFNIISQKFSSKEVDLEKKECKGNNNEASCSYH